MAVAVILLTIISLFAIGMAVNVFQPAVYDLFYQNTFWSEDNVVDQDLRIAKDTLYNATIAIPVFGIGALALWAYLSLNRNEDL